MFVQFLDQGVDLGRIQESLLDKVFTKASMQGSLIAEQSADLEAIKEPKADGALSETTVRTTVGQDLLERRFVQPPPGAGNLANRWSLGALPDQSGNQGLIRDQTTIIEEMTKLERVRRK